MKLFLTVLLEIGLLSCKQGEGFSSVSLAVYLISVTGFKNVAYWGQTIIFLTRGEGEKFSHANIFYYMQLLLQTTFLSPSFCKHFFYLHTIYFSVYSLCKQFISKFSNPPVKKIIVRSSRKTCYFKSAILLYSVRPKQHEFCSIHSIP